MGVSIERLDYGTAFDHLKPGNSGPIARHLRERLWGEQTYPITSGQGYESESMGRKDMLKLDGYHIENGNLLTDLALIDLGASIVLIKGGQVVNKRSASECVPDEFHSDLIDCENGNCISRYEAPGRFVRLGKDNFRVRCHYCDAEFDAEYNGR